MKEYSKLEQKIIEGARGGLNETFYRLDETPRIEPCITEKGEQTGYWVSGWIWTSIPDVFYEEDI